jgi:hypothetical protein
LSLYKTYPVLSSPNSDYFGKTTGPKRAKCAPEATPASPVSARSPPPRR